MAKRNRNKAAAAAAPSVEPPAEKKPKKSDKVVAEKKSKKADKVVAEKKSDGEEDENEDKDDVEMDLDELVAAGGALAQLAAHDAAAEIFAKALALSPGNVDIMSSLAKAYEESDQTEEALVQYRDIVRLAPQHAATWFHLGSLLVESSDVDGAIDALKHVIALEDNHTAAFAALASCYGEKGDIDAAVALFEGAVEKHPTSGKFHYNLATMLAARGKKKDRQRAVDVYEKAAALDAESRAEVLEDLAQLHEAMGSAAKAEAVRKLISSAES